VRVLWAPKRNVSCFFIEKGLGNFDFNHLQRNIFGTVDGCDPSIVCEEVCAIFLHQFLPLLCVNMPVCFDRVHFPDIPSVFEHCVGRMQSFGVLKRVLRILTTRL
jgi:hypothetical protein